MKRIVIHNSKERFMIPVMHLLVVLSLCTAQQSFGMKYMKCDYDRLQTLGSRHEGRELLRIASTNQIEPFIGNAVACRKDRYLEDDASHPRNNPPSYGVVERTRPYGPQPSYFLRLYCPKDGFATHAISDRLLAHQNWFVRLLTLDEVRWLSSAIKEKEISPDFPANGQFTLGNLLPEEQIKYFRQQVKKNEWQRLRLLFIGQQDPGSPLHLMPKDLIRSFARSMVDEQVQQLRNNAKLGDVLEL